MLGLFGWLKTNTSLREIASFLAMTYPGVVRVCLKESRPVGSCCVETQPFDELRMTLRLYERDKSASLHSTFLAYLFMYSTSFTSFNVRSTLGR